MAKKSDKSPSKTRASRVPKQENTAVAERSARLNVIGRALSIRYGYDIHHELDAVYFYLVCKHNWLPSQVRALSDDDLLFLTEEEMVGWALPFEVPGDEEA